VIIVGGDPTHDIVAIARRLRPDAQVLIQTSRGRGDAPTVGFGACTGDIVVTVDADASADPAETPRFAAALCADVDFVKASRFAEQGASRDMTLVAVRAASAGLVNHEVPSCGHDRVSGASSLRAARDRTRALRTILPERISAPLWRYIMAGRRHRGQVA
jgi:hypothetical protein